MELTQIKERFGIIGNNPALNRAIEVAKQVAATDLSVLVTGESGVGKEFIPKIIHTNSPRKHNVYIAVNCGAIPEGTIDSELFGHEKGSFTGATEMRKGYFEEANGGTLFLDEVAELPLGTQVRLLRVLQTGEFLKVGSSKVQRTDVRVIAATNINLQRAIDQGNFREDLFYRLNTVPIKIPSLRERREDIHLLFRKFAGDFAEKYTVPTIRLTEDAVEMLESYRWPGNVRQLKSVADQISVLETNRIIDSSILVKYLPVDSEIHLPVKTTGETSSWVDYSKDRDVIFKILLQLRQEVDEIKGHLSDTSCSSAQQGSMQIMIDANQSDDSEEHESQTEDVLSIQESNVDLIRKAIEKHGGRRKAAAAELGISERTLYRKIKEYGLE